MKKIMKLGLAIALSISVINFTTPEVASAEVAVQGSIVLADKNLNSVRIYDYFHSFQGSGFFIKGGYVVTNSHIHTVNYFREGYIVDGKGKHYEIKLVAHDVEKDLALYKSTAVDHTYLNIADKIDAGIKVSTVVNSFNQVNEEFYGNIVERNISSIVKTDDIEKPYIVRDRNLFDFKSIGGNSGSPIFNDKNEVIGVIMGHVNPGQSVHKEGSAVAVTLDDLKSFLEEQDI